ncbi:hypothetical protein [Sphingomonas sp.]|uniref:hypothetical protein n=1 Tax=Sphingomonas sp. TaxID=28214 RepID=UPI001B1A32E7|nr:hypothetical protein [Sphingomonas sp.]MBO9711960.1 hypothetical protein [Sphingomonas sp.]
MSSFCKDDVDPAWEPVPWDCAEAEADRQALGFGRRAGLAIDWRRVPWSDLPPEGVFGLDRERLSRADVQYFASLAGEELLLIENVWSGWPDPPPWGLMSRQMDGAAGAWSHWGHFRDLPAAWRLPAADEIGWRGDAETQKG